MDILVKNNENPDKKFHCQKCDYYARDLYDLTKHFSTRKHENPEKTMEKTIKTMKKNSGKKYADDCDHKACGDKFYEHYISTRIPRNPEKTMEKLGTKYTCDLCDFHTNLRGNYANHLSSKKHNVRVSNAENPSTGNHTSNRPPDNTVTPTDTTSNMTIDKEIFYTLLKQNQEFKELIIEQNHELSNRFIEQSNAIMELAKKEPTIVNHTTNNTNTINNNQKFNLNIFLYEKCKDALNLTEFINSLEIGMEQLEYMGEYGYVNAISKVIVDKLNEMDVYKRPIHCTDIKRDTLYVKENDQWMKDTDNKKLVRKLIDNVGTGHNKMLCVWQDKNPKCLISDTFLCKLWFKLTKECINTGPQGVRNDNEIIKNIANAVYLDRGKNIMSRSPMDMISM